MKRSLRALENLQTSLSNTSGDASGGTTQDLIEKRRAKEAAKALQLKKLSPYKRAEYLCLECVAELRDALRDVEELQFTLHGVAPSSSGGTSVGTSSAVPSATSREEREAGESTEDEWPNDERAGLLGGRGGGDGSSRRRGRLDPPKRHTAASALQEQELLQARQRARRAHQRLQQLQRDATRLALSSTSAAATNGGDGAVAGGSGTESAVPTSTAALASMEWQRAERHVEVAKAWYRDLFGIHVVSSLGSPAASSSLQLNRPAQPQQSAGSMSYFGRGANALPPGVASSAAHAGDGEGRSATTSAPPAETGNGVDAVEGGSPQPVQMLLSAREDAEFKEFFASVQANDELMDAALDRLSEGLARLLDNARDMQDEMAVQEVLLQGTETRINENEADIANMNRRLRRAIRDMEDSSVCVYVMCLLVLLVVLALLLRVLH